MSRGHPASWKCQTTATGLPALAVCAASGIGVLSRGGSAGSSHRTESDPFVVRVGEHQVPAGAQHPGELRHHRPEVGDVGERQGADDDVDLAVGKRQPMQVATPEVRSGHAGARTREHVRRAVDADDPVPQTGEVLRVSAGAARRQ